MERSKPVTYRIFNNESAKGLPYIVFWTRNGQTERAAHLGKRGEFKTLEEAQRAVENATRYGTQKV
jgi:hypothetical protein